MSEATIDSPAAAIIPRSSRCNRKPRRRERNNILLKQKTTLSMLSHTARFKSTGWALITEEENGKW